MALVLLPREASWEPLSPTNRNAEARRGGVRVLAGRGRGVEGSGGAGAGGRPVGREVARQPGLCFWSLWAENDARPGWESG